jgi:hypothetical protein
VDSCYTADLAGAWTDGSTPNLGSTAVDGVYGAGVSLLVGSVGSGAQVFCRSSDAAAFTQVSPASGLTGNLQCCDFGEGRFLVAEAANYGRLQYSDDGCATFTAIPGSFGTFNPWGDSASYPNDMGNRNSVWSAAITGTSPGIWTSTNKGAGWTKMVTAAASVNAITPSISRRWCAVCSNGDVLETDDDWAT